MPESDDIRTLVPITVTELASGDRVQVFDASTNTWKQLPANAFAVGDSAPINGVTASYLTPGDDELTYNGADPQEFNVMVQGSLIHGRPFYEDEVGDQTVQWGVADEWILADNATGAEWRSNDDVATPDLVTTWVPQGSETGTPTFTLTAQVDATPALPPIRIAGGFIYALDGGVWKQAALSALS